MKLTARELAQWLDGTVEGNADSTVDRLSKIEEATTGSLSFLANPKYLPYAYTTGASILIVNHSFVADKPLLATLVRVADAQIAFGILLQKYQALNHAASPKGIEPQAYISPTAHVDSDVYIGAFAYIGANAHIGKGTLVYPHCYIGDHVKVGDNSILYAGVKIYAQCEVGNNCIIHAGAVIGSDGFGFAPQADGSYQKIPQTGNVIIENDVEIGANTTIDRATLGATRIKRGAKLDNLVQIAHNVEIGEHTVIAAQAGVAGSTHIGARCMIGGQVGFAGHLKIADGSKFQAQSGIAQSIVETNQAYMGSPAFNYRQYQRSFVVFKQLPELATQVRELKQKIEEWGK
jgi:UDP-3-O-[3-hydroxymyristoyl] glucosamine N-acyltransferase